MAVAERNMNKKYEYINTLNEVGIIFILINMYIS